MLVVLHTADIHIGVNRKLADYLDQQGKMLREIVRLAGDELCHASNTVWLVVSGDVFERNQDTRREELSLFLTALVHPLLALKAQHGSRFEIFLSDGNHDRQPNPAEPSVLSAVAPLLAPIHVAIAQPVFFAEHGMLVVPFGEHSETSLNKLIAQHRPTFMMAHECLARMETDVGYTPPRDQDHGYIEIENVLRESSLVALFLGDIHKCQQMDAAGIAWYSGSPITHDFGHRAPKGVLRHEFDRDGAEWTRTGKPRLIPLRGIREHRKVGTWSDASDIKWALVTGYENYYVDVIVTHEVYKLISDKVPDFFRTPLVQWGFARAEIAASSDEDASESSTYSYYGSLISEWSSDNLKLSADELQEVVARVNKDFDVR